MANDGISTTQQQKYLEHSYDMLDVVEEHKRSYMEPTQLRNFRGGRVGVFGP